MNFSTKARFLDKRGFALIKSTKGYDPSELPKEACSSTLPHYSITDSQWRLRGTSKIYRPGSTAMCKTDQKEKRIKKAIQKTCTYKYTHYRTSMSMARWYRQQSVLFRLVTACPPGHLPSLSLGPSFRD